MIEAAELLVDHLDIWTRAIERKNGAGRGKRSGSSGKISLYGIDKLRSLILDLAVRGKLVPQDPADGDAGDLVRPYRTSKQKLLKEKRIRNQKVSAITSADEMPFETPDGWVWARLGEIGFVCNGNSISAANKEKKYSRVADYPFIATKDVGYGFEPLDYDGGVWIPADESKFAVASAGTTLICSEGGSAGKKCGLTERNVCFGNKLFAVNHYGDFEPKFLLAWYQTATFYRLFSQQMTGIIGGISLAKFIELPCPVPSLAEQKRIVAKVDELMALVDALEAGTRAGMEAHEILVRELLTTLVNSQDADDLAQNWSRIEAHFDALFTTEESIDALKQTIVDLALRGQLVPQDPNDESGEHLLGRITSRRLEMIRSGILKKQKMLPEPKKEELLFSIPTNWVATRLQSAIDVRDGTHDSPKDASGSDTYPLVTSKDFKDGSIDFENARRISAEDHAIISQRSHVERDDILFSMIGGNIGNQVIVASDDPFSIKNVALFKYYSKEFTLPQFVKLFTESIATRLQSEASGGAQAFVSLGYLRNLVFPLPSISEQKRIVARVHELVGLCNELKASIRLSRSSQVQIADTLGQRALS